ncbi:MAG: ABC transporter substrate-binding protein [Clostridia bacterium]|nr:ABC transporter substrate-binding protein [Clostridia bacterium]
MKKLMLVTLILCLCVSAFCFAGCSKSVDSIVIAVPDGGPALGMSYLMKEFPEEIDGVKVTYKIVDGANGIKAAVLNGEADVALMPTNMAAILYNGGLDIKLVGTNSYGLLYLLSDVTNAEDFSLTDLRGKVLHTLGKGGTPEIVLKKVLESASIEYEESNVAVEGKVALKFHDEGKTIIAGLKQGNVHYAILGEPAVSTAIAQVGGTLAIVCDMQEAWKLATDTNASYPQTALVAKGSLIESDKKLVNKIAKLTYEGSVALTQDAAPYIAELKAREATVPPTFGAAGVARTNILPEFGATAKADVIAYFTILKAFKAPLIGGDLPDDNFYYIDDELTDNIAMIKAFA